MHRRPLLALVAACLAAPAFTGGCSSTGIALREKVLGQAKRDQLVSRVQDARDSQEAARKQFQTALDEFLSVTGAGADAKVSELESRYRQLKSEYDRSESRAQAVRDRISSVENVAAALFKEWKSELAQYSSADLRAASQRQLDQTQSRYDQLLGAMKQAAARMDPVLAAFKDQTLFLKHNLNARAIASLQGTTSQVQSDVASLIREMERSIEEANRFIADMQKAGE